MTDWLLNWKGMLTNAVIFLTAVLLGFLFREGTVGNIASIVGVSVSILGFIYTVGTVLDARRQITEASGRAEAAILEAREETVRAIAAIATHLRIADCAELRYALEDLRQSSHSSQWIQAIYRCQEGHRVAYRLAEDKELISEAAALRDAADNLNLIRRFIEQHRLTGQAGPLTKRYVQSLDQMIALLARIQGRLHHEALRSVSEPSVRE